MERIIKHASSVSDYTKILSMIQDKIIEEGARFDGIEKMYFRGQSKQSYELLPSIARSTYIEKYKKNYPTELNLLQYEGRIVQDAIDCFPELLKYKDKPLELLSILQHHGLPTRLLDITENAFVALYFATEMHLDNCEENGEVFCFCYEKSKKAQPWISDAIAEYYSFGIDNELSIDSFVKNVKNRPYYREDSSVINSIKDNDVLGMIIRCDLLSRPMLIKSSLVEMRQRVQNSSYLLFGNKIENRIIKNEIKPIDKNAENIIASIVIKAEEKQLIRQQLEMMGINRKSLFPDSKDIVFEEIKNEYKRAITEKRRRIFVEHC